MERPPTDSSEHAKQFALTWADKLEEHCTIRMQELGIPDDMNGQPDFDGNGRWRAFNPYGRQGGENTTGVVLDSGVLNPDLLKGQKGGRLWANARLRDRVDATIAHEYEELRHGGSHTDALKAAAKTAASDFRSRPADQPGEGEMTYPAAVTSVRSSDFRSNPSLVTL